MFHLIFSVFVGLHSLAVTPIITSVAVLTVLAVCALLIKSIKLYCSAKQKHRDEWLDIYWFVNSSYGRTGITLPRALFPLLSVFVGKKIGLTCAGVRIHIKNSNDEVLLCLMAKNRRIGNVIYDLGVGGAVPYDHDIVSTAREELYEEASINEELLGGPINLSDLRVTTPADKYNCIVYNYTLRIPDDKIFYLTSKDGTYETFNWIRLDQLAKMDGTVRNDPFNFLVNRWGLPKTVSESST
ncbi:putative nudix family protein [Yasminevirus sp. GU-2018]|uniref:Putative nudix family protein n=1 Tax=Yasminevirus sp. GU-2018 TaxID=2420051 RepID=A0A5K0UAE0_9VIRU|nr:putative nudix family protein [Yasminevirus sp. GU-2018]